MKHTLIAALLLFFATQSLQAQTPRETKLLDKMSKEACDEIDKQNYSKKDDLHEIEVKLGLALLPSFTNNRKEIKEVWGLDVNDPNDARAVGEKLGAVMVYKCPKFQKLALQLAGNDEFREQVLAKDESSGSSSSSSTSSSSSSEQVSGAIDKIEGVDVNYVFVKTDDGETMRLMWLEQCPGSDLLEKYMAGSKGIRCKMEYKIMTVYQPKTKSYQPVKVITSVIEL